MFAQYSFRPRRWQCLVLQQSPDAPEKPIHWYGLQFPESIAIPAGCK
jgi:hypothetical protein